MILSSIPMTIYCFVASTLQHQFYLSYWPKAMHPVKPSSHAYCSACLSQDLFVLPVHTHIRTHKKSTKVKNSICSNIKSQRIRCAAAVCPSHSCDLPYSLELQLCLLFFPWNSHSIQCAETWACTCMYFKQLILTV